MDLYNRMADSTLKLDDFFTFYFSLAAHNDAVHLDEARETISMIFKPELRPHVKGKYAFSEQKEEFLRNDTGLLGGSEIARERIKSGDAMLGKSTLKRRVFKRSSQRDDDYYQPVKKFKFS